MGSTELKWCDGCGTADVPLTTYLQMTDFQSRTTDWNRCSNALELCDACLEKSKKNFQNMRKYTKPRTECDADRDAKT